MAKVAGWAAVKGRRRVSGKRMANGREGPGRRMDDLFASEGDRDGKYWVFDGKGRDSWTSRRE